MCCRGIAEGDARSKEALVAVVMVAATPPEFV
jgi:hypothetical protein